MAHYPDMAYQSAMDLLKVEEEDAALDKLFYFMLQKRKVTWTDSYDKVVSLFIDLGVKLRQSHKLKDGFLQFRWLTQYNNSKEFMAALGQYLDKAEKQVGEIYLQLGVSSDNIDDVEAVNTPGSLLCLAIDNAVHGKDSEMMKNLRVKRKDKDDLAPWLRFLWESYKNCMELVKCNFRFESLYKLIVERTMCFCYQYQRRTEFRKLTEILRNHYSQCEKAFDAKKPFAPKMNSFTTQKLFLHLRLSQLEKSILMENWTEAHRTIDVILQLPALLKINQCRGEQVHFLRLLGIVFWKGNYHLFHALTLNVLLNLYINGKKTQLIKQTANQAVLAALAIPIVNSGGELHVHNYELDALVQSMTSSYHELHLKLASMLDWNNESPIKTRNNLLKEYQESGILKEKCDIEIQNLFVLLQEDFSPFSLCEKITEICNKIYLKENKSKDVKLEEMNYTEDAFYSKKPVAKYVQDMQLDDYIPLIEQASVTRLMKQLSQVFHSMSLERFRSLLPKRIEPNEIFIEKLIIQSAKECNIELKIDHLKARLVFDAANYTKLAPDPVKDVEDLFIFDEKDHKKQYLQPTAAEEMQLRLINAASILDDVVQNLKLDKKKEHEREIRSLFQIERYYNKDINRRIEKRTVLTEERKKYLENMKIEKEIQKQKAEEREKKQFEEKKKEEHQNRQIRQNQLKDQEMKKSNDAEIETVRNRIINFLENFNAANRDELEDVSLDDLQEMASAIYEKQRQRLRDRMEKYKHQSKRIDHIIRAFHETEVPLLEIYSEEKLKQNEIDWNKDEMERVQMLKKKEDMRRELSQIIKIMKPDVDELREELQPACDEEYKIKFNEWERKLEDDKEEAMKKLYLEKAQQEKDTADKDRRLRLRDRQLNDSNSQTYNRPGASSRHQQNSKGYNMGRTNNMQQPMQPLPVSSNWRSTMKSQAEIAQEEAARSKTMYKTSGNYRTGFNRERPNNTDHYVVPKSSTNSYKPISLVNKPAEKEGANQEAYIPPSLRK
ncbi:hypothetical protein SNEBB_003790 [Seison nebaliae]|nr:hypothetical protein SNEBB_003790 [Seison nebaliae]